MRAIDIERAGRDVTAIANALANELLFGGSEIEVGLRADGTRLAIVGEKAGGLKPGRPIPPGAVFVASGGARGVTAAALVALAMCTFAPAPARAEDMVGTGGPDRMVGSSGDDTIASGAGDDVDRGRGGFDDVWAGAGDDRVFLGRGGSKSDPWAGDAWGGGGEDVLIGGPRTDFLFGEHGSDVLRGRTGADQLSGGPGADRLTGGSGRDRLTPGEGRDRVNAAYGADLISVEADGVRDLIACGRGYDTVVYAYHRDRRDQLSGCERIRLTQDPEG